MTTATRTRTLDERLGVQTALPVLLGLVVAVGVHVLLSLFRPMLAGAALGGLLIVLPTFIVKDGQRYWVVLFLVSTLLNIAKLLTGDILHPSTIMTTLGMPASGTLGIRIYPSDLILLGLLLHWLARVAVHRAHFHFPLAGLLPVVFLIWALCTSMFRSVSLWLSFFELAMQCTFFAVFLFAANNVTSRGMLKGIFLAVLAMLVLESVAVIALFQAQAIGDVFAGVTDNRMANYDETSGPGVFVESGTGVKRSKGTFSHPSHAAMFFELTMPFALAGFFITRRRLYRFGFAGLLALGLSGLLFTFSRTGLLSLMWGLGVAVLLARYRRWLSRTEWHLAVLVGIIGVATLSPKIYDRLVSRPEAFSYRFVLMEKGAKMFARHPITGLGYNNISTGDPYFLPQRDQASGYRNWIFKVIHNYYQVVAIETGVPGALLYFGFMLIMLLYAFQCSGSPDPLIAAFGIAVFSAMAGLAMHWMADPFGVKALGTLLWFYGGAAISVARFMMPRAGGVPVYVLRRAQAEA